MDWKVDGGDGGGAGARAWLSRKTRKRPRGRRVEAKSPGRRLKKWLTVHVQVTTVKKAETESKLIQICVSCFSITESIETIIVDCL